MHSLVVEEAFQHREAFLLSFEREVDGSGFCLPIVVVQTHHTVSSAVSLPATVGQRLKHPRASIIHKHTIVLFFRIVF